MGRYHALGGRLAPLDHIGPEDLTIDRLLERVRDGHAREIILALGADVEGEATAQYLAGLLRDYPEVTVTRIAQGLPAGGGLGIRRRVDALPCDDRDGWCWRSRRDS